MGSKLTCFQVQRRRYLLVGAASLLAPTWVLASQLEEQLADNPVGFLLHKF